MDDVDPSRRRKAIWILADILAVTGDPDARARLEALARRGHDYAHVLLWPRTAAPATPCQSVVIRRVCAGVCDVGRRAMLFCRVPIEMKTDAIVLMVSGSLLWAAAAAAQPTDPGGVFTAAQAAAGRAAYEQACAECHRSDLRGTAHGTELSGVGFMSVWGGRAAAELFEHARSEMPPGAGGSLEDETYLNIAAYILQANGLGTGEQALSASTEVLIGEAPTADPADLAAAAAAPDGTQPSEAQMAGLVLAMPSAFVQREGGRVSAR